VDTIEIGYSSVNDVYSYYGRENVRLVDVFLESTFTPALEVYVDSKKNPSLLLYYDCQNNISTIIIDDDSYKTEKNIAIGSTFSDLKNTYSDIEIIYEDYYGAFVYVESIKMSFRFSLDSPLKEGELSNNAIIDRIIVL
jgi:hypothetical protein